MNFLMRSQIFSRLKDAPFAFSTLDHGYLRRCAGLSLIKRWGWILGMAVVGLALGLAVSVATGLLVAALSAVGTMLTVALQSVLRHRTDWQARTDYYAPLLRRL
jgi:hypothetical protein